MRPMLRKHPFRVASAIARCVPVLALLAISCSPATHYYTLSPVDPGAPLAKATPPAVIAVGPVQLPDYVDRPQIVVRTGPHTLDQAAFDQWGGDLNDMIPRLLVEDLARRLPGDHLVSFPDAGDVPYDFRVPVDLSQFDVTADGEAVVVARWQVRGRPGSGTVIVRESTVRAQAAGKSYDQRVEALSRALADLTGEIAAAIAPLRRGGSSKPDRANAGR
jgi:uncharacterized lipoprotein YmbA